MRDVAVEHTPAGATRVLDVGCGTGVLARQLADALPASSITGVDISRASIQAAIAAAPANGRIRFEHADYLRFQTAPVDLIVTDTALHFVRARPEALWRKLAADLAGGGTIVCCMAYDGVYNRALGAARTVLRAARSAPLDRGLLWIARRAFGRDMDDALLRERIEYMYIPPEQLLTRAVTDTLAPQLGLRVAAVYDVAAASATQLKQRITVFRKDRR